VPAKNIHCLKELVQEDEWTNKNETAEEIPSPKVTCSKFVGKIPIGEFITYPRTNI
jgi:hypothetical protein